ncbi:dihydrolipoyl dehydrogenase [Rhodobaculum claviforme]|uniref:Dihydrolipoyl dehydrogenase n=1 Tax=Rhodobaculum claviforme TaxID=1549854 RepID=A0A934TMU9_9RHOB|nr:dihydrolipoyl dehydrogenase [Rhodobaculum claviforme]MBK5928092.1 dihydrolipoyl dehydrogenase [Rhodobaculum claviforme]
MTRTVDVAIVGAGTAGLSALREVRRETDDFVLIDAGDWGTTCAARGCMPSKALIEAANALHRRHSFAEFGLRGAEGVSADIPAVLARVRALRDDFVKGPQSVHRTLGDRAIAGRARLLAPDRLEVNGDVIHARAIILAPGSHPVVPGPWAALGDRVLTSDTLFELPDLPRRIAVVGLGAIGVELAQALARLGCTVTGFDAADTVAGLRDPDMLATLLTVLEADMAVHLGAEVTVEDAGGGLRVTGGGRDVTVDAVLAALGRAPNVKGLGLETLGVDLDARGLPQVDPNTLRIGDLAVWMAGDANADRALLHEAADEGHIAGRNAVASDPQPHCRRTPLSIVFCAPQVARVGTAPADCNPATTATATVDFARQGRARTMASAHGRLTVAADRRTGTLRGAEICAPAGEHMAHLLALAVEQGLSVAAILAMPFYHPVLEEGLRSALRDLAREVGDAGSSDLSPCPPLGIAALE